VVLVARIADVFQISGRGVLIALDRDTWAPDVKIRNNDEIQLRTPDGRTLDTKIVSIEFLSGPKVRNKLAVLLPADITNVQVPAIFLAQKQSKSAR
jgi:hypothetical protein